ncbi:unnamed protein product [Phytophthora fragariaefolia]|uniref:Unnamed protein product n=1 Tax=Phytophthora fragariaefolia TaxID=1490495 RepID=A0A9W6WSW5_9STRA|nr:unnamed protein product [Phytophthora fragariaefolia]
MVVALRLDPIPMWSSEIAESLKPRNSTAFPVCMAADSGTAVQTSTEHDYGTRIGIASIILLSAYIRE